MIVGAIKQNKSKHQKQKREKIKKKREREKRKRRKKEDRPITYHTYIGITFRTCVIQSSSSHF